MVSLPERTEPAACAEHAFAAGPEAPAAQPGEHWRALFDQAPCFMAVLRGPRHRFEYANARYLELVGRGPELIGRTVAEAVPEAAEQGFVALLDGVLRSGEPHVAYGTAIELGPAGARVPRRVDFVYQPMRDADGAVGGVFVHGVDVTDRKRMEAALAASEQRLQIGLDAAEAAVYDWNVDTGELHWTDGHYRLLGLEPRAATASYALWRRHVHPDDLGRVEAAIRRALDRGERCDAEYRIRRADGAERWVQGRGLVTRIPGQATRMIGALIDVDDRRRAEAAVRANEARFRTMADGLPTIVWVHGADGGLEFVNQTFCEYFATTREAMRDGRWQMLTHPDDGPGYVEEFLACVRERRDFAAEVRVRRGDGEWRWLASWGRARFAPDGSFLGHVGTSADITERKRAEQALREADRRKDEFIATLSHELRNPLAPIRNAARLLAAPRLAPESLAWARGVIDRQVGHMARLLDDLLDVARITGGKLALRRERIALRAVVEAAIETARPAFEAGGHALTVTLPPGPAEVDGDAVRLAQVYSNLLANAAKYTDPGGHVELRVDLEDGWAVGRVRDDGIGIEPESLDTVFEMFAQAGGARARSEGGLGIGLALVRGLVELHGGRVSAHSEGPGRGTEFVVRLPLAPATTTPSAEAPPVAPSAGGRRVLVADDNRDSADSLAMLLRLAGHDARVAHDGAEALEVAARLRPEVALLDIGMPKVDGYEVARRLRAEYGPALRLVAITGWGQEEDRLRAADAGFDLHVTKPLDPDRLESLLAPE